MLSAPLRAEFQHQGFKAFSYTKFQLVNILVLFSVEEKTKLAVEKRMLKCLHLIVNAHLKLPRRIALKNAIC